MSVSVQVPYKKYTAAPGATVFPTTFRVVLAGDLKVRVDGVVVTSGFTLSALGLSAGLDVTFTTPKVGGEVVELQRIIPKSRANDYQQLGNFDAATVNSDLDRAWMSLQEVGEETARAVKVPIGSAIDPTQLIADLLATQAASEAAAADAEADKLDAQAAAAAAAASAATTGLPALLAKALNFLRVKADETGYETRTPEQVRADIGAAKTGADDTITSMTALQAGGIPDGTVTAGKLSGSQSGSAPLYGCRAWVSFNGTGTVAINASGNVSSITDNGTGDYTINFTTAMPDANYCVLPGTVCTPAQSSSFQLGVMAAAVGGAATLKSTTQVRLLSAREIDYDLYEASVAIFR